MATKVKKLTQKQVNNVADELECTSSEDVTNFQLDDIANSKQVSVFEQTRATDFVEK